MDKETLEELRYKRFVRSTTKNKFNFASLPSTTNSARYHAFRTYHQVQKWYGNEKDLEDWGWKLDNNGLWPITITEKPAPDNLLNVIFCNCKKGCGRACSCRKSGLKCSLICRFCNGELCQNKQNICVESDSENDENLLISSEMQNSEDSDEEDNYENMYAPGPSRKT